MRRFMPVAAAAIAVSLAVSAGLAPRVRASDTPPGLTALQEMEPASGPEEPFAAERRGAAMRLAALGFGSRAGLARRSWEIAAMLDRHGARLDAIYRFGPLMLREDGFAVLPPVLAGTRRTFRLAPGGVRAASAEEVLRIVEPARLVSAPPGWRDWLRRSWPEAAPPASVLFPRDGDEALHWRRLLAEGWAEGQKLADDIFAGDLDRLNRTFEGVILWHRLHRAARVTAPGIEVVHAGVSGHERLMRIGAASARIAGGARFELDALRWAPPAEELP